MSIAVPASLDERPLPRRLHPGASSLVGGPYPNLVSTRRTRGFLAVADDTDGADLADVVPLVAAPAPRFAGPYPNIVLSAT
jgi:hypothetical protein